MSQKVVGWLSVVAVAALFAACNGSGEDAGTATSASTTGSGADVTTAATPTFAAPTVAPVVAEPVGEQITVGRVVDGDTFDLTDGRTVRVLGIDSCEMKAPETYGGEQAKSWAEGLLVRYRTITLTAEPGAPDVDRYGRLLRYVQIDGLDFGTEMVKWDHTGVYQGDNDASQEYIDQLYANDLEYASSPPSGRECGDPYPPSPASGGGVDIDNDDDGDRGLPDGALTGGYCARKWWC